MFPVSDPQFPILTNLENVIMLLLKPELGKARKITHLSGKYTHILMSSYLTKIVKLEIVFQDWWLPESGSLVNIYIQVTYLG